MPLKYLTSCSSSSGKCESCASIGSDVRSKHTDLMRSGIRLSHAPSCSISCQFTCDAVLNIGCCRLGSMKQGNPLSHGRSCGPINDGGARIRTSLSAHS